MKEKKVEKDQEQVKEKYKIKDFRGFELFFIHELSPEDLAFLIDEWFISYFRLIVFAVNKQELAYVPDNADNILYNLKRFRDELVKLKSVKEK